MILSIFSTSDPSNLTNHILEFVKNLVKLGLWTVAGSGLLISMLEKLNWFHLTGPITLVLLISYGHALNAVVISGLVLLFATWNC